MPFKKLFALAKKTKVSAVPRNVAVDIAVTVEQTQSVFGSEEVLQQDLESPGHVHVRMIFDENGEMVSARRGLSLSLKLEVGAQTSCKLEHLEVAKAAPAPLSNATTLVGSPMPSKPVSPTAVPEDVSQNEPADSSFFATIVARVGVPVTAASAKIVKIPASSPAPARRLLKVEDFCVIRVLGEGGQGLVSLVQDKITGNLYALKAIKKHRLQTRDLPTVFVEQDILKTLVGRPFFTSLKGSFEDEDYFFLLMDYCPGGDLDERIRKEGKLPTDVARRYAAQIVLAMEDLRRNRIVHRDVKPKNILLTAEDEVIITDFGLARTFGRTIEQQPWRARQIWQLMEDGTGDGGLQTGSQRDKSVSGCGTFGYIAPEMFSAEYSYEVDVWSFAVTLYEMLHGKLPFGFDRTDGATTHELITRSIILPVEIGSEVDADATDLLQSMLAKDPLKRPTWEQIKEHPWFDSIDWNQMANRQPSPSHEAPDHLQPEPHARYVKFGEPYAEGKAEYPFFHWIAPELFVKQTYASCLSSDSKHSTQRLLPSASWVSRTSATSYCSIALATLSVARSATPTTAANSAANSPSDMLFGAKTTTDVFDAIMSGTSCFGSESSFAGNSRFTRDWHMHWRLLVFFSFCFYDFGSSAVQMSYSSLSLLGD
ncbi:hypothetical protein BN946_scf184999.g75 [Trametes cinnabarina]|uniref:non-specific serine/threonine protein kinase n=1 Tax=Pycnoporus cinnabarinus TaxID=5643 RepID=A0A060SDT7_PYCCI|nr:hypothetical protein BN946_scf184999.g75 [Trametes cinnabarina]